MTLPSLYVLDNALTLAAQRAWVAGMRDLHAMSTPIPSLATTHAQELMACVRGVADCLVDLLAGLMFVIRPGNCTTPHLDIGEYVALYYPSSCPSGPLRLFSPRMDVEVISNRLVLLDATSRVHQQVVPIGDDVRHSVALKFRLP